MLVLGNPGHCVIAPAVAMIADYLGVGATGQPIATRLLVGGHARGQAILRVHTERGWVVLASDAVHLFEETDDERPFVIFYDLFVMIEGYRRINRMAGHRDLIIPGHDSRVTKAYPPAAPGLEGQILMLHAPPVW